MAGWLVCRCAVLCVLARTQVQFVALELQNQLVVLNGLCEVHSSMHRESLFEVVDLLVDDPVCLLDHMIFLIGIT